MKNLLGVLVLSSSLWGRDFQYSPAPVDNPLKGFVPYAAAAKEARFPCSMEFRYFALQDLMTDWDEFNWELLEQTLTEVQGRGRQLVFRVHLEYPGQGNQLPQFLINEKVKVTSWQSEGSKEVNNHTPDYENPLLRKAMQDFIQALGKNYDGDPRIGFLTAGLLGSWGEWHTYPKEELWAAKTVQSEVMTSFQQSFSTTKVLLRYPAGKGNSNYAENQGRPFGYHDDSFAWDTLDNANEDASWTFCARIKQAQANEKWKTQPIGGELRPELWEKSFTDSPHPKQQDFDHCVEQTHASWLMDTGLFDSRFPLPSERKERASASVQKMGYELHIASAKVDNNRLTVRFQNKGVAPFYYDWPVELAVGETIHTTPWSLKELSNLQGVEASIPVPKDWLGQALRLRVANPMEGGRPLKFANAEQGTDWMELGTF